MAHKKTQSLKLIWYLYQQYDYLGHDGYIYKGYKFEDNHAQKEMAIISPSGHSIESITMDLISWKKFEKMVNFIINNKIETMREYFDKIDETGVSF